MLQHTCMLQHTRRHEQTLYFDSHQTPISLLVSFSRTTGVAHKSTAMPHTRAWGLLLCPSSLSPTAASLPMAWSSRRVNRERDANERHTAERESSKRKPSWLLLPKGEGWQMCAKLLSERKMQGTEQLKTM